MTNAVHRKGKLLLATIIAVSVSVVPPAFACTSDGGSGANEFTLLGENTLEIEAQPRDCEAAFPWKCLVATKSGDPEPVFIYETIEQVPNLPENTLDGYNHNSGCAFTWVVRGEEAFPDGEEPPADAFPYNFTFVKEVSRDCSN